jgi:hypothetical protein
MDILDKAYDYIDYTLEQLAKLEESSVSLLYFFKLFSPAGKLAQHLLVEHSFIETDGENGNAVIGITERGRAVLTMGGIRKYLDHLDMEVASRKQRVKQVRKILMAAAVAAGSAFLFITLKNRLAG